MKRSLVVCAPALAALLCTSCLCGVHHHSPKGPGSRPSTPAPAESESGGDFGMMVPVLTLTPNQMTVHLKKNRFFLTPHLPLAQGPHDGRVVTIKLQATDNPPWDKVVLSGFRDVANNPISATPSSVVLTINDPEERLQLTDDFNATRFVKFDIALYRTGGTAPDVVIDPVLIEKDY